MSNAAEYLKELEQTWLNKTVIAERNYEELIGAVVRVKAVGETVILTLLCEGDGMYYRVYDYECNLCDDEP